MQHRLVQENVFTKIHTMIYIEKKNLSGKKKEEN